MTRTWAVWALLLLAAAGARAQPADGLVSFDCRTLELHKLGDRWQLKSGPLLKDLGTSEADAREAVRLLRNLRLTQHGTIGKPQPVIEYWLSDNAPPVGFVQKSALGRIDLGTLRVERCLNQWCLADARQVLFTFGPYREEAQKALAVLQRYQFNRVGYVGAGVPIMMFFLSGSDPGGAEPKKPQPIVNVSSNTLASFMTRQLSCVSPFAFDAATGGERLHLDWRQAEVHLEGNCWKLYVGLTCLADFGKDASAARAAVRIVRYYRFTEQCRLGNPLRPFSLFLVHGKAPAGICPGVRSFTFQTNKLSVRGQKDDWRLYEEDRPIVHAGTSKEEAHQVLDAIQRYQLDTVLRVGQSEQPGMSFLVKQR